jgi:hypothetical protein
MSHDSIFGGSVFGGVVTGADASTARPILPGSAFYVGSQVSVTRPGPLGPQGMTANIDVTKRVRGITDPRVVGEGYDVGAEIPMQITPHAAGTAYDLNIANPIPGTPHAADRPYFVGATRTVTTRVPGHVPPTAGFTYRVGGARAIGPEQIVYGAGGGAYVPPTYGPRQQGIFHAPPRVQGARYAKPHGFGPPVIGEGALGGLIGMG